jgi:hypothetical protein
VCGALQPGPAGAISFQDRYLLFIGGETGGSEIEGERFGHHPDLYLVGHIQPV